jgi:RNA polymerase sigma factor (sigma-70 family)
MSVPAESDIRLSVRRRSLTFRSETCSYMMSDVYVIETPSEAVERVYREHGDRMWRALFAYSGDREVASDALAETFARLLHAAEQPRDPVAWAWRVAFRVAARELRERQRTTSEFAEPVVDVEDEHLDLVRALARLSPKQRACLVLHHYAGYPVKQVAALTGSTTAAVKVHLSVGRKRLRRLLEARDG